VIGHFLNAVGFLSVLPLRGKQPYQTGDLGRSALFFPLVGVLMGALTAGANYLFGLVFPSLINSALTLCFWIFISGGLHLDGVADCFDGMLNASAPERRLEIMKDSRLGTFGGLGLILLILLKFVCLLHCPERGSGCFCLWRWGSRAGSCSGRANSPARGPAAWARNSPAGSSRLPSSSPD